MSRNFLQAPPGAKAALFFLEGNYQFNYREGEIEKTRYLTPGQIGRAFATSDVFDSGWYGKSILRCALLAKKRHKILSFLPAGQHKIFVTDPRPAEEREDPDSDPVLELKIPLPGLLLLGTGKKYYLWATLDKTVTAESQICPAPLPNLDGNGSLCLGSNQVPECRMETIEAVWQMIFSSPFNDHHCENRCRPHPKDVRSLLLALDQKRTFPRQALFRTEHTVSHFWNAVR